jgi:hypothetical protein
MKVFEHENPALLLDDLFPAEGGPAFEIGVLALLPQPNELRPLLVASLEIAGGLIGLDELCPAAPVIRCNFAVLEPRIQRLVIRLNLGFSESQVPEDLFVLEVASERFENRHGLGISTLSLIEGCQIAQGGGNRGVIRSERPPGAAAARGQVDVAISCQARSYRRRTLRLPKVVESMQ